MLGLRYGNLKVHEFASKCSNELSDSSGTTKNFMESKSRFVEYMSNELFENLVVNEPVTQWLLIALGGRVCLEFYPHLTQPQVPAS